MQFHPAYLSSPFPSVAAAFAAAAAAAAVVAAASLPLAVASLNRETKLVFKTMSEMDVRFLT